MSASRAVCCEDRDPILGLRPRRVLMTARGQRKGPLRAPQPLTRTAAPPAGRHGSPLRFDREVRSGPRHNKFWNDS
ncbi:hypothetical protein NDU88_007329 [Pleurodeles waltl]|uniref:Uncharacterized protein n=1 Tax=Pleurodeles waltl TaxID=8319 RepID=A0AAV7MFR1_PLEWA|nr:hypothetical protein NDU88_007329 [Pleurodeles waltl]